MQLSKSFILICIALTGSLLFADNFEIVEGKAGISGKPNVSPNQARQNWDAACEQWKIETKDLNKKNELMSLSCDVPSCSSANDDFITCSSTGTYQVKTAGTRAQPPVAYEPPMQVSQTVVETAPPPIIYETVPAPRPGFIWINGYWGWHNHHHYWYGGHWGPHDYRLAHGNWRR